MIRRDEVPVLRPGWIRSDKHPKTDEIDQFLPGAAIPGLPA